MPPGKEESRTRYPGAETPPLACLAGWLCATPKEKRDMLSLCSKKRIETESGSSLQTAAFSNYAPVPMSTNELVALLPSKVPIDRKLPSVWRRINSLAVRRFIHVDVSFLLVIIITR